MAKSTRTTISIPAGLKARMEATEEPVNWSALACTAFESKLAEIISRKGAKDMSDVVSRLRASKERTRSEFKSRGFEDGEKWAKESAEAIHLERLEALSGERDYEEILGGPWETSSSGVGEWVFEAIEANGRQGQAEVREFWDMVAGEDHDELIYDPEYVAGFVEGAMNVWLAVKDQL